MAQINDMFEQFQSKKNDLLALFDKTQQVIAPYKLETKNQQIRDSKQRLEQDSFKVLVVGEFKRGKSTFINALLGEEVLPAYATPCTAVINEVKYAQDSRAILHFANPLPKKLPDMLTPEVKQHLDKYRSRGVIPPMPIRVEDIEKYVVIPDPGKDQAESISETPFSLVELYWPLKLCENGVEIIDSPGLNEHKSRSEMTQRYFSKVDTVIFVMSCDMLASASEMDVVDSLRRTGFEDIFFICNRFDQVREREREHLKDYAIKKLSDKTSLRESGIHFVSSADALDAKLDFADKKIDAGELKSTLEKSGFFHTEEHLIKFLTEYRGKIKILQPGRELRKLLLDFIDQELPSRKKLYEQKYEDLKAQKEKSQPALQLVQKFQQQILRSVELEQRRFTDSVKRSFRELMREQIDMVPEWIDDMQFSISWDAIFDLKGKAEEFARECMDVVQSEIQGALQKWQEKELKTQLDDFVKTIKDCTERDFQEFNNTLNNVKEILELETNDKESVTFESILTESFGGTIEDIEKNVRELLKKLYQQLVVVSAPSIGLWDIIRILIDTITSLFGNWKIFGNPMKEIKVNTALKLQSELKSQLSEQCDDVATKVNDKTGEIIKILDTGLTNEHKSLEDNVNAALQEMESSAGEMTAKREKIEKDLADLKKLRNQLLDMIDSIQ